MKTKQYLDGYIKHRCGLYIEGGGGGDRGGDPINDPPITDPNAGGTTPVTTTTSTPPAPSGGIEFDIEGLLGLGDELGAAYMAGSEAQVAALMEALGLSREMFEFQKEAIMPFLEVGQAAIRRLGVDVPAGRFDPGEFNFSFNEDDPAFQFLFNRGIGAIDAAASAKGLLGSGSRLKDLNQFGVGVTSQEMTNQLNRDLAVRNANVQRLNSLFNQEAALAGVGQTAAGQVSAAAGNFANTGASLYGQMGAAQSAGIIGAAQAPFTAAGQAMNFGLANQGLINQMSMFNMGMQEDIRQFDINSAISQSQADAQSRSSGLAGIGSVAGLVGGLIGSGVIP